MLEQNIQPVTELKQIDPEANSFYAGGVKFIIHPSLSVGVYRQYQEMQVLIGFNADYDTMYTAIMKAYADLNSSKFADAAVKLNGVLEGVARKKSKQPDPVLLMCSMFIRREGADLSQWSEAGATEDIDLWTKEGIDIQSFFFSARHLAARFNSGFYKDSPSTLVTGEAKAEAESE